MTTSTIGTVIRSSDDIAVAPRQAPEAAPSGVTLVVLNEQGGSYAGIMHLDAGHRLPEHRHHELAHHMYVIDGDVEVFGRALRAGSYWYVPPGEEHHVRGLPPDGCDLLYLDVPR